MAKILIVEDRYLIAAEMQRVLEMAGHEVVGLAPLTQFALDLAERHPPDLAIVDLQLALDLDGVRTAAALADRHGCRIVISTGYPVSTIDEARIQAKPAAVLRKPFSSEELLAAVSDGLRRAHELQGESMGNVTGGLDLGALGDLGGLLG